MKALHDAVTGWQGRRLLWIGWLICLLHGSFALAATRPVSIDVVLDDTYPPYSFRDASGQVQGITIDLWRAWETHTGIKVNLRAMDWAKAQEEMQAGRADVIDTISITEARQKRYDFLAPYADIEVPIFFHKNIGGIAGPESLRGFTVGAKDGDACIGKMQERNPDLVLKKYTSHELLAAAAVGGEIRVFCMGKPAASYFLSRQGALDTFRHSAPVYGSAFHQAVRKGNSELMALLVAGFSQIDENERRKINEKWLGTMLDLPLPSSLRYAGYGALVILTLVLLLGGWNHALRRRVGIQTAALQAAQQVTEQAMNRLDATLEAIPDLLFEVDAEGRYLSCRAGRPELLMAAPELLLGKTIHDVLPNEVARVIADALSEAGEKGFSLGKQYCLELNGETCWFELSIARKKPVVGEATSFIALARDITERKCAADEIEQLAFFDPLTQLPNRRFLLDRLQRGLASSIRRGSSGAILFLDLDHFKVLNDTRGHHVGDLLLLQVAQRLKECVRIEDCVARLGGDEFVVLLEDLKGELHDAAAEAEAVGQKILDSISRGYTLNGFDYHCSASIGISLFSGRDQSVDDLLKRADAAMYRAKASGRNALRFFDPAMQQVLEERTVLESALRNALPQQQFDVFYQEQRNCDMAIVGAEALLRWRHPDLGMIGPLQFIRLAEESGLIVPIGLWVIERACEQLKRWEHDAQKQFLQIAVNVSGGQFRQYDFVRQVRTIVTRRGVDPSRLTFELTEGVVLDDVADTIEKMHQLKRIGIRLSIDDFGLGYSSLSYLKRLPLDELKIDKTFVRDIASDSGSAAIAKTIIAMARTLGFDVVAEGVENEAQKAFLQENGCQRFQGFLFGRPMPVQEFELRLP